MDYVRGGPPEYAPTTAHRKTATMSDDRVEFPDHIWLIDDPDADEPLTWSDNPNPYAEYGEEPRSATKYVRADISLDPSIEILQAEVERLREVQCVTAQAQALLDKVDADSSVRWKFFNELRALRQALAAKEQTRDR